MSAVDRVRACPTSAALPQVQHTEPSEAAAWGTGVHAYLRDCAVMGVEAARKALPKKAPWRACCLALDPSALWAGASEVYAEVTLSLDLVTGTAQRLGTDLGRDYSSAPAGSLVGTADLVRVHDGDVWIYDYKTGHEVPRAEDSGQLAALAVAAARAWNTLGAHVAIVRVREDGSYEEDSYLLSPWDLDDALDRLRRTTERVEAARRLVVAGQTPDVTTGPHCKHCPAFANCPAQNRLALRLTQSIDFDRGDISPGALAMSSETAGIAWVRLQQARRLLDEIERAVKARIDHDGSLPLPDGSTVSAVQVTRESIDAERAIPVLRELLGDDGARACVEPRITKAAVEAAARAAGLDPRAVLGALRSASACPSVETTSYRTTKAKNTKEHAA